MLDAKHVPCSIEKLPRVRAILSWNIPVFGPYSIPNMGIEWIHMCIYHRSTSP